MPTRNGKHATSHLGQARKHVSQMSDDAVAAATDFASHAVDDIRERVEAGQERLQTYLDDALESVRERPLRMVLAAVGVGCVIGWILKRR